MGLKKTILLVLVTFSQVFGQKSYEVTEHYNTDKLVFDKKPSIISIPFDLSIEDLQKQINTSLPAVIYEDVSFEDNENDDLKARVTRKGDLIFTSSKDDVFYYELPLKVWVQKRIGAFGISQTPSTEFEIIMRFSTKFSILTDYSIATITNPNGFDWITKPVIKTGYIDLPIAPIIGKIIANKQTGFAKQIDDAIKTKLDIKPYLLDAWNKAKKPFKVSDEYNTWIKIEPVESYLMPLKADGKSLKSTLGFKIFVETLVGTPAEQNVAPVLQIPNLKLVTGIPEVFNVFLFNVVSYEEATNISKKMFVGQTYDFRNGKYKIQIDVIDIYGSNEFLVLKTTTSGSFKGTIYIKGIPAYDPLKKKVVLTKTVLDIKTKNFLHKSAAWLLEGVLERKIENEFGMPVEDLINYAKSSTMQIINSEVSKGIRMKGDVLSIEPKEVKISKDGILSSVEAKAKVQLIIKGL